ncbi:AAA family ATPase [Thermus composti]|uniref:AAA family ATPase n=1 Tax=Thermus composti TaxID=532059 RepID=UPI001E36DA5A
MRCLCGQKNPPGAQFCMGCGRPLGSPLLKERRHVSVVFLDLVDSTSRFQGGLEAAYREIQAALERAAQEARLRGGFVHRFLGDAVMVLFGAPRAQGMEPWRALEAAQAMVKAAGLPARAGVASGEVLWAPLGEGQAGEATSLGPPAVRAERLSKVAAPQEVVCDGKTLGAAPGTRAIPLGPRPLKGLGEVEAFRVEAVGVALGPEEASLLEEALRRLLEPGGRVNLVGPPGSGKSLLLAELVRKAPLRTVVLERMGPETPLRLSLQEAAQKAFGGLETLLHLPLAPHLHRALRYSLGLEARPPWPREALEEAILEAWEEALKSLSEPLLLVLKDFHAPDPTLLRFLGRPLPQLRLAVESRRPLFQPALLLKEKPIPPLLALQPALDGLPFPEKRGLLVLGVLGEAPQDLAEGLAGPFSWERLWEEGLLEGERPLPSVVRAARALVLEEEQGAWHLEAARYHQKHGDPRAMARHLALGGKPREAVQTLRVLAQGAWRKGRLEEAIPLYEEALALAPEGLKPALEAELQDARASLGQAPETEAGPRAEDPVLKAFRQAKDPLALQALLPHLRPYPLEEAQARLELAGALWRAFRPKAALQFLTPFHPHLPPSLHLHYRSLRASLLMDLGRYEEAEALLAGPAEGDREAHARFHATRLRFLLEQGRLPEALEEGEAYYAQNPHPWLAASLLGAQALRGRFPEALYREAQKHPDGKSLAVLALALHTWKTGRDPRHLLKEALVLSRKLSNPYVHHLALATLALFLWPKAPRKAQALSQHLLYQTHRTGFAVHLEIARLLRAQLLLEEGERVDHLLVFVPSTPLTQVWQRVLAGEAPGRELRGYGILGRWIAHLWAGVRHGPRRSGGGHQKPPLP